MMNCELSGIQTSDWFDMIQCYLFNHLHATSQKASKCLLWPLAMTQVDQFVCLPKFKQPHGLFWPQAAAAAKEKQ